jgi:hypothetical protein
MRPLKYKNLGEMSIMRVPYLTAKVLPRLQAFMQEIEESDRDSVEVLCAFFDSYKESLRS